MSADNWAICPQCKASKLAVRDENKRKAEESYGKVDAAEYLRLLQVSSIAVKVEETMREDYEIGVDDEGVFHIGYYASCNCGFKFEYKHTEVASRPTGAPPEPPTE